MINIMLFCRSEMELSLPNNFVKVITESIKPASQIWADGEKARLIVNVVKLQSALSQLKPTMFSEDKYENVSFAQAPPIGGLGFL